MDICIYRKKKVFVTQSCPTLCDPMDCRPASFLWFHGILQSRILEWVAMHSSRISSRQILDHLSYREATKNYEVIPCYGDIYQIRSDQSLSHVRLFATP